MEAESSQGPRRESKRPARIAVSDSEEDDHVPPGTAAARANGRSPAKRRKETLQVSDDDQAVLESDSEEERRTKPSQVTRRAGNGHAGEEEEAQAGYLDQALEGAGEDVRRRIGFRPEYDRGSDGYVAGSVVRIKMRNFMTYDLVEFRPGPHLNMILGPNGTGKSSIAAGIAIGLGFHPKVMGRAHDLKSYVKQGAEEAETEIELKGPKGKRNLVIWRRFTREDDKSEWRLNAEAATKKTVTEAVVKLGIQANNLCSFLPQDKVAEFAKMAPITVLKETMRAAGDPRLTQWHETLCEKGAALKDMEAEVEKVVAKRDHTQTQKDRLEPEVQNLRNREEQERERERLQIWYKMVEHKILTKDEQSAKADREAARLKLKRIRQTRKPLMDLQERQKQMLTKANNKTSIYETNLKDLDKGWKGALRKYEDAVRRGQDTAQELDNLKERLKRRDNAMAKYRADIAAAEEILNRGEDNREALQEEIRAKAAERSEKVQRGKALAVEYQKIHDQLEADTKTLRELSDDINLRFRRQQEMSSVEVQREQSARNLDPSIGFALDWLKEHGHTLEMEVCKPPMISVSVRDRNHAWQVEMLTSLAQRKTFICQTQKDYETMLRLNNTQYPAKRRPDGSMIPAGKVQLYLAVANVSEEFANPQRPCSPEVLHDLGFDGFAIDFVEAPAPVICYLNENARLYASPITLRAGDQVDAETLLRMKVRAWITRTESNRAVQSAYGSRGFQTTSTAPIPAKAFNLTVDNDAIKQIVNEIAEMKRKKEAMEKPTNDLRGKDEKAREKHATVKAEAEALEADILELKRKQQASTRAAFNREEAKRKLAELEKQPSADAQRAKLKDEMLKHAKKRSEPIRAFCDTSEEALDLDATFIDYALQALQYESNRGSIEAHLREGDTEENQLEEVVKTLKTQHAALRMRAYAKVEELEAIFKESSAIRRWAMVKNKELIDAAEPPSLDGIAQEIDALEAAINLMVGVDPQAIQRYQRYTRELEELQATVASSEQELAKMKQQINRILGEFDPALDTLVKVVSDKFSAAFHRVGCAGEVRVNRVEGDFSQWGIQILVAYRDGDNLSILTGSHQSGGERSLATVTYLMSLSEMARTPFSLVDEINQGMDQRAERNVHNQLVEVTCATDAGQYFLITPKLLTGLRYHERMKILVVNNGVGLPDPSAKTLRFGDLSGCVKRYAQTHAISAR